MEEIKLKPVIGNITEDKKTLINNFIVLLRI